MSALLVAPAAMVLLPLVTGEILRALGVLRGASPFFDTIPAVAAYLGGWLGWLAIPAVWVSWRGFLAVQRRGPRIALCVFLMVHVATIGWTVHKWL